MRKRKQMVITTLILKKTIPNLETFEQTLDLVGRQFLELVKETVDLSFGRIWIVALAKKLDGY